VAGTGVMGAGPASVPTSDPSSIVGRSFVQFPPRTGTVWVPAWSRRAALAGLALRAPCRRSVYGANYAIWGLVAAFGPWMLRGSRRAWRPPMPEAGWEGLCQQWREEIGAFDGIAVYQRPQASRPGLGLLLLLRDRALAFVKAHQGERSDASWEVLTAFDERPSRRFEVPRPFCKGNHEDWQWLAMSPMPSQPHRPARRPALDDIIGDIQDRVGATVGHGDAPAHWAPMHGDLTPWNLRQVSRRGLWLLDWDEAGWGPPMADQVYYEATASLFGGGRPQPAATKDEAVLFWQGKVSQRSSGDIDRVNNVVLAAILERMATEGPGGAAGGPSPSASTPTG
jgi:hypothetical protein